MNVFSALKSRIQTERVIGRRISLVLSIFFLFFSIFLFAASPAEAKTKPAKPKKAAFFPKEGEWLNARLEGQKIFQNKLTLIYFWEYTSINSLRELQYLKEWYEAYHPHGLELILVHAPEFEFSKRTDNVKAALERFDVTFPVFLDNDFKVWDSYRLISWPTKVLVDEKGFILQKWSGEGGYAVTESLLREALKRLSPQVVLPLSVFDQEPESYNAEVCGDMSFETSMGYKQPGWVGVELSDMRGILPDQTMFYRDSGLRILNGFFVQGKWTNRAEHFEHARDTDILADYLGIVYSAHEVYAVLNSTDGQKSHAAAEAASSAGSVRVYVTRDELPVPELLRGTDVREDESGATYFLVREPRLYYLVTAEDEGFHELKLWPQQQGVAINSFSFSNRCLSEFEHV